MLFAGGNYLTEFRKKVLAHGAISHFAVALDAVAQLVNSFFLVHLFFTFWHLRSNSRSQNAVMYGVRGAGLSAVNTVTAPVGRKQVFVLFILFSFYPSLEIRCGIGLPTRCRLLFLCGV